MVETKCLLALLHPLHGSPQLHGEYGGNDWLCIELHLGPKAAAHVHRYDPHLVVLETEDSGDLSPLAMRFLGGIPDSQCALPLFEAGDHGTGLHWAGDDAGLRDSGRYHAIRLSESCVRVPRQV